MADANVETSASSTFERERAMALLAAVAAPEATEYEGDLDKLNKLLEMYQEQPTLLDPHLEDMMEILTSRARALLSSPADAAPPAPPTADAAAAPPAAPAADASSPATSPSPFQYQLDTPPQLHALFRCIYMLCRCRGPKTVVKFFPHQVADLEPAIHTLLSQDRSDYETWHTRYGLLLWLSMLGLVPFDICTIDSSIGANDDVSGGGTLVGNVLGLARTYLGDVGPTRDTAAMCIATLLARPDMEQLHLKNFMEHVSEELCAAASRLVAQEQKGMVTGLGQDGRHFVVLGVLAATCQLFKRGHRDRLAPYVTTILSPAVVLAGEAGREMLMRKLLGKLIQRLGMAFLPPRVVAWRYSRGQRSLLQNLGGSAAGEGETKGGDENDGGDGFAEVPAELEEVIEHLLVGLRDRDTVVRWSAAKGLGRIASRLSRDLVDDIVAAILELFTPTESDAAWHGGCLAIAELSRRGLLMPSRLPEVVPLITSAIAYDVRRGSHSVGAHVRDAACYVFWAFSRAYTPVVMAPHVGEMARSMLLAALFDREINCRRAASAAFQENVGRQGHENFAHGIEILTAADFFTLGNVRNAYLDISSFVAGFETYRLPIIDHLAEVRLFHWDPAIRELASNALGRLAKLDLKHVVDNLLPTLVPYTVSPDLIKRHGALLGVAELVAASGAAGVEVPAELVTAIVAVVPNIEKARLYRGRGGEIVRKAVCRLIECIALAKLAVPVRMQVRLLDSIDDCLKSPLEAIADQAVAACRTFTRVYFPVGDQGPSERLQKRIVEKYVGIVETSDLASTTRGFALALGALPRKLVSPVPRDGADPNAPTILSRCLGVLTKHTAPTTKVGDEPDAETRRNAVSALVSCVEEVGLGGPRGLSFAQLETVFDALLSACGDYSTDKRGDVGSWTRMAALKGLWKLTVIAVRASTALPQAEREAAADDASLVPSLEVRAESLIDDVQAKVAAALEAGTPLQDGGARAELSASGESGEAFYTPALCERTLCALLKQLSEKLDHVRTVAGQVSGRSLVFFSARAPAFSPCRRPLFSPSLLHPRRCSSSSWRPRRRGCRSSRPGPRWRARSRTPGRTSRPPTGRSRTSPSPWPCGAWPSRTSTTPSWPGW